ncbi:retroviral-like aspartic protease, partial [Modestobacter lapidis]|nr:retroviral-like aspartic protease [Modestobacter lapidis]
HQRDARVQIDPGSALNLISTSALEEPGIPPSKLSHTSVSIFGYDGSAQRPIGKIRFKLQIGDLISEVTVYAIKTPSCYNILLGRPWIHENGVVPSTLHQCIKFVGDDGLIHRVFADKKPFKGKEVHFADSQMYKDGNEEKEEKIASFAENLQKDKGKAPQQSPGENKP